MKTIAEWHAAWDLCKNLEEEADVIQGILDQGEIKGWHDGLRAAACLCTGLGCERCCVSIVDKDKYEVRPAELRKFNPKK